MENRIQSKSFKETIESVGRGCKFIFAEIQDGLIHVYCKAKSQNNIIFKVILNETECVDLINSYGLYNKDEIIKAYQEYINATICEM